jgi:CspA family cold shock protein
MLLGALKSATRKVGPMSQFAGTVRWFNNAKGYGFLGRDDGPDVFVHYSSIQREGYKTLKEGDSVNFDVIQGTKGPQADQVSCVRDVLAPGKT